MAQVTKTLSAVEEAALNVEKKPKPAFWDAVLQEVSQGRTVTEGEVVGYYDKWAADGSYEQSVSQHGYGALDVMERTMSKLFPDNKDSTTILDVGACTGFNGQRLYQMGFRAIDALDPSRESLRVAKLKGVYRQFFNVSITGEPLDIPQDTYDAVVLLGVLGPNHLPLSAFTEMIRLVKPGGYIVNLTRADFLHRCLEYIGHWESMIAKHETEGRWKLLEHEGYPIHFHDRAGELHVFQVCDKV